MKKCNACGAYIEQDAVTCASCGSNDVVENTECVEQEQPINTTPSDINDNGNIVAGVVGAFLFSIIGGILYFIVYQFGFIAGICGLVMFVLANFGYSLFAGTKNRNSVPGLVSSIVCMIVMLFLAEYLCLSYEIFRVYQTEGITFFDAVWATPQFLAESDISGPFISDLLFAYIFGFFASISNIKNIIKARKG